MFVQLSRRRREEKSLSSNKSWLNGKARVVNGTGPGKRREKAYKEDEYVRKFSTK
jgi:hypothetical protein